MTGKQLHVLRTKWFVLCGAVALTGGLLLAVTRAADKKPDTEKADTGVARARKQVQMLDDLYKTAIVLITKNYVTEESDLPAGAAFKALFAAMKEKGYHEVRLIDATGSPYEEANSPRDDFEKSAIEALKGGQPYVDVVVEKDGKRYLRAATAIPVVMEKCVMCHANYADAKKGEAIGALGYTLRIE